VSSDCGKRSALLCLAVLTLAAFLLRLGAAMPGLCGDAERFSRPDTPTYLIPAHSLAETGSYSGTGRAPGFPALAALVFRCGGNEKTLAVLLVLLSTAVIPLIYASGTVYCDRRTGLWGAAFFACNPTAVANAPMMLSDTLFSVFAALQLYFFLLFWKRKNLWGFLCSIAFAALGTLIRPINLPWILPALVLLFAAPGWSWRKKFQLAASGTVLFFALLFPWMHRNAACRAGYVIDTNTGAMYHQNGAMILAAAGHTSYEAEKQRILRECETVFADTKRFPDTKSREAWRMERFKNIIAQHPFIWFRQHFSWHILLPDAPTLMELLGVTSPNRGTMDILAREGVFSAVKHYFSGHFGALFLLFPLLLAAGAVYAGALLQLFYDLKSPWQNRMELLVFLAFSEYYFFLPGPITTPRYQLPALPFLVLLAAAAFGKLRDRHAAD